MAFTTNYESDNEYSLIPEGIYETILHKAEERTTRNGIQNISMTFVIRNDVDQPAKNRYVFYTIWKKREPNRNDDAVGGYSFAQLMRIAKMAGLPSGKSYDSISAFLGDLIGKQLRVSVEHDTWQGQTRARVDDIVSETQFPTAIKEKQSDTISSTDGFEDIIDDDVPF